MMNKPPNHRCFALIRRCQRGVSMVFALIALVVLTLGAVALVRSVDSGLLVMGNLGFKQSATSAAAQGAEVAVNWLAANAGTSVLDSDNLAQGYRASSIQSLRPTARSGQASQNVAFVDWDDDSCGGRAGVNGVVCVVPSGTIDAGVGQTVRYVITRLCPATGAPSVNNNCIMPVTTALQEGSGKNAPELNDPGRLKMSAYGPYFRIIARTQGNRGTVSFTETLVHF